MPASPARAAAFDILLRVEQEAAYAAELLHAPRYAGLTKADHGLATELVMGVLRWQSVLDHHIAECSSLPLRKLDSQVLIALRLAAYQLAFLDRVPQRAAVHESVELVKRARKRSAVPFANAVLRKLVKIASRHPDASIAEAQSPADLAQASAHPLGLVERWVAHYGLDMTRQICLYNQQAPETSVRIVDSAIEEELKSADVVLSPGRLLRSARRVISGTVTSSRAFREGRIFIQDEGSQLVALLVGHGEDILDCCAAPGGKTRILAEQNPAARIVASEQHPHRARLLRRLVPAANVEVVTADARNLPADREFDRILVDVPCSGTGTLARNPEIKWRLQSADINDLRLLQQAILQSAARQLAPGGHLVYSTCSLEREENEDVVEAALAENPNLHVVPAEKEIARLRGEGELAWRNSDELSSGPYLRTVPGVHPCDGFFAAILENQRQ